MRQDAVMNSDAIVEAARKLLIEQGAGVSMRAIAREAGVGVATASRHFPRRIELLDAVGARAAADIDRIVEAAVSQFDDDPDGAWHEAVHAIAELKAADLGQALFSDLTADTGDEAERDRQHYRKANGRVAAELYTVVGKGQSSWAMPRQRCTA